jgi:hypothetical protein
MAKTCSITIAVPFLWAIGLLVLAGCEGDRLANIPPSATLSASGNAQLTYTAPTVGTFWVYDVNSDRIVYTGSLGANQSVSVDPVGNQIMVEGRVVFDKGMNNGDQQRIYFEASGQ